RTVRASSLTEDSFLLDWSVRRADCGYPDALCLASAPPVCVPTALPVSRTCPTASARSSPQKCNWSPAARRPPDCDSGIREITQIETQDGRRAGQPGCGIG